MKKILGVAGGLLFSIPLVLLFYGHVFADDYTLYYVDTNRLSYTGTVSTYATLADAQAGTYATGMYPITNRPADPQTPYRDAILMMWSNGAYDGYPPSQPYSFNMNDFYTNVYSSTVYHQGGEGTNNPNKTPEGIIQLTGGDYGLPSTSNQGFFHGFDGTSYTEYTLQVTGGSSNLTSSRLWNAPASYTYDPNANLSNWAFWNNTLGTFISYQLNVTFEGLAGIADQVDGTGILATNNPTSVNGTFKGVFQNTNTADPTYDGFYVADLTFGLDNWAYDQGSALDGEPAVASRFWGYAQADPLPEPSALFLLAFGLTGIVSIKRRLGPPTRKSPPAQCHS
ncbi:MAG TPA: PEP-CTERM sorting domain-containing protein [Syntrophorhabdales bacterium]|nr:PEP-CTERM sorting domain-containing protein [Syntrophorhabdales bacterium]